MEFETRVCVDRKLGGKFKFGNVRMSGIQNRVATGLNQGVSPRQAGLSLQLQ